MNFPHTAAVKEAARQSSPEPAGYLLSKFGLLVLLAVLLIAVWYGQIVIVVLLGSVMSAAGLAKLWSRLSLAGVSCQRFVTERRLFPGEHLEIKLRLVNRKPLPLPWIQVDDEIPLGFAPGLSLRPGNRPGSGLLSKAAALLWYTGASWQHRLYCHKRGYYTLGPVTVTSGDIFGFYPRSTTKPLIDHIIVYPKIFPIAKSSIPLLYPLGETKAERRIFQDPARTIGVREYTPDCSLRQIHWKASARHQSLQVKVFEPTTTLKLALFLAIDSFHHYGVHREEEFELGISTAASIANHFIKQSSPVGLFVNSRLADSGQPARITPSSSGGQLVNILEALAKVTLRPSSLFEDFLQGERKGLPWGTTLVLILSHPSASLTKLLASLRIAGYRLLVLQIGDREGNGIDHAITWYNVRYSGDLIKIGCEGVQ